MNNERNPKEHKEPCKGKQQREKEFKEAVKVGMEQYDVALRHLADR